MTEQEFSEAQIALMDSQYSALTFRLYDEGVPGINRIASTIISANFSTAELLTPNLLETPLASAKLAVLKPIFREVVEQTTNAATTGNGLHGDQFFEFAIQKYTQIVNSLKEASNS